MKKIAIPTVNGILCPHFGHCEKFCIFSIEDNKVVNTEELVPPPHEPGLLPKWLGEKGIHEVLAGGMGQRAISLFEAQHIKVSVGASPEAPEVVVEKYLNGSLSLAGNACDH